jgi:hypothetical protein
MIILRGIDNINNIQLFIHAILVLTYLDKIFILQYPFYNTSLIIIFYSNVIYYFIVFYFLLP